MATVKVTSELVESDGSERVEFFAEADSVSDAIKLMLENEQKVAEEDWYSWVEYWTGFHYSEEGFTFAVRADGSRSVIMYRYAFTA